VTPAYIAYVRPILEHDCVTWSPHLKEDIEKIERSKYDTRKGCVDLKVFDMVKDCVGCNCVLWNCDGYTLTCICVTALYLGVSVFVYQSSLSLAMQPRPKVIPIGCINDIVAIMLVWCMWTER